MGADGETENSEDRNTTPDETLLPWRELANRTSAEEAKQESGCEKNESEAKEAFEHSLDQWVWCGAALLIIIHGAVLISQKLQRVLLK